MEREWKDMICVALVSMQKKYLDILFYFATFGKSEIFRNIEIVVLQCVFALHLVNSCMFTFVKFMS
jgi:hypothetical protein